MTDDLKKRGPQDRSKVNVHESWEVVWWCKEFEVTEQQLKAAVKAVGVETKNIARHLGKKWPK